MAQTPSASRPLSPHLGIYRKMLTMMMSIVHRITGAALYAGTLLLAWWLVAAASGAEAYDVFTAHAGAWYGRLVLIGYTWALIHHMLGGLRHLVWDMGKGFNLRLVEWMARGTIAGSIILTILVWVIAYQIMGAL